MNCIRSGAGCREADPLDKSLTTEHGMQMRLCRCDMGVVTLKEKVLLDDLTGIRMEGSGGLHIVADGEVKLEGQEVNLNGNRGVTIYEGKAVPDLEKLLDTEEGALLPEVTVTAAGKVELTTEEGENTVQNRGEKVTYYLAWEHADLSHPSNRYRDEPEQKNYDWAQWRLNIAAGMVVVGSVTILGAVVAGAAAGAGMIAAGNISAGSAASSVGGAVFLTGSLYVAEQAVSDAVSGRLGDTEKYVRKALAGSVVGFLTGASGLMMQGASLGKVLSLGFGEGFLGSTAAQGLLNEDGEINWALAIGDGMFSVVMAGLVWNNTKIAIDKNNEILRYEEYWKNKALLSKSTCSETVLYEYLYHIDPDYAINYAKTGIWPNDIQIPKSTDVLNKNWGIDWMQVPEGGYVLDANGNPVKSTYVPNIGDILDRYGAPNGTYTAPVINGKTFDYVERALPYVEDISKYHQYKVVGDFSNIQDYIQNCEDLILKTKIEAAILKYHGASCIL